MAFEFEGEEGEGGKLEDSFEFCDILAERGEVEGPAHERQVLEVVGLWR